MVRNSRIFPLVAILLMAATGCVQPVEIEPPAEREVFVKCILEKGSYKQRVVLLYSGGIGEDHFEPVTEATVNISGDKRFYAFQHMGNGVYEGRMEPVDGETYTLKAAIPGRDTLVASTTMPRFFSVTFQIVPPEEWLTGEGVYPEGRFFFWVDRWINPWYKTYSPEAYDMMKEAGDSSLHCEMPGIIFEVDSLEQHHLYILGREEDSTGVVASIRHLATNHLLVDHVNANGRKYHVEDTPAFPDTARRPKYERLIKKHYEGLALHDGYLRIDYPVNYDNGLRNIHHLHYYPEYPGEDIIDVRRYFTVVGDFEYNYWGSYNWKEKHPVLYFCTVSEEYDRYLRSVQSALVDREGDLLSTLYGESGGYSNVRGGCGVFGATSTIRYDCDLQLGMPVPMVLGWVPYPLSRSLLPEQ